MLNYQFYTAKIKNQFFTQQNFLYSLSYLIMILEIWDNKVPRHQFGYPSAWQAMILLVENSDRIASAQRETKYTIAANPSDTHVR